jgi:hypothetical protein
VLKYALVELMNLPWGALRAPYLRSVAWVNAPVVVEAEISKEGNNEVVSTFFGALLRHCKAGDFGRGVARNGDVRSKIEAFQVRASMKSKLATRR